MPTSEEWIKMFRRFDAACASARKEQGKDFRKTAFMEEFAKSHSTSRASFQRQLKKWRDHGPESLVDKRGWHRKNKTIIAIAKLQPLLDPLIVSGKPVSQIIRSFKLACERAGKAPPHEASIRRYIMKKLHSAQYENRPGTASKPSMAGAPADPSAAHVPADRGEPRPKHSTSAGGEIIDLSKESSGGSLDLSRESLVSLFEEAIAWMQQQVTKLKSKPVRIRRIGKESD